MKISLSFHFPGVSGISRGFFGFSEGFQGFPRVSGGFHGFSWVSGVSFVLPGVSLGCWGFLRDSLGFQEFPWVFWRFPSYCHKREYWWEFVVFPQSSILHPKSTKFGKLGIFNLLERAQKSLHTYHNQKNIASTNHK